MGINFCWIDDLLLQVQALQPNAQLLYTKQYVIINLQNGFFLHLVPLKNNFAAGQLIELQNKYQIENKQLIHIWEDVWIAKSDQVLFRLNSFLGLNTGFHARKTKIVQLDLDQTKNFLNSYHLQGYVSAKYSFGLIENDEIIALATFSDTRLMKKKGANHQSAELVRFASKNGITVVGGLSKLIKHFTKQINVDDIMTYADRDWSLGKGYDKLGFEFTQTTDALTFYVNENDLVRYLPHRLPKKILIDFKGQNSLNLDDFLTANGYVKVFNTGNLKYHLYL